MHDKAVHRGDMLGGEATADCLFTGPGSCVTGFRDWHRCLGRVRHARSASVPRWSTYSTIDQLDVFVHC